MHSPQSNAWQNKHTYSKTACLWRYRWQEQMHSTCGSTTISLAKMNIMLRICQKYFIAKVEQDWFMLWHSIIANKGRNGSITTYLQNIITEHLQNMHGSLCSIKFTWQQNNSRQRLGEIIKSLKSETLRSLVCMHVTIHLDALIIVAKVLNVIICWNPS